MFADIVLFRIFFQRGNLQHRFVQHFTGARHAVPEQAADPGGNVYAGPLQFSKRHHFEADDPQAARLPDRLHAQQVQKLRKALAVAAHVRPGP